MKNKLKHYRLMGCTRPADQPPQYYQEQIEKKLKLKPGSYTWARHRESLDARKGRRIQYVAQLDLWVKGNVPLRKTRDLVEVREQKYEPLKVETKLRPIIVGTGPAGLFAARTLLMGGVKPILLEQGEAMEGRVKTVEAFWQGEALNPWSNVQFGEGGAGTFSDGKLTSRSKDPRGAYVNDTFAEFSGDDSLRYMKKPHMGTDALRGTIVRMRREMEERGASFHFNTRVLDFEVGGEILLHTTAGDFSASHVIWAVGNGARDLFERFHQKGLAMEAKATAMGFRIEQPQEGMNLAQYGEMADYLPPAEYALTHPVGELGTYTFCMCPGGVVVNASSEAGRLVTNGMSYKARDGENANAALLVTVDERIYGEGPLSALHFQRKIEERAHELGRGRAPAETAADFLARKKNPGPGKLRPTFPGGVHYTDLHGLYPEVMNEAIMEALLAMGKKLPAFLEDAVLTAPETRSSSPVRLLRNGELESISHPGCYFVGEGAGYAGGIVSSAIDGMRGAEAVLKKLAQKNPPRGRD
ncbi:MAG: FAD-dependent oxidoreductase [Tissierellia bacterium]|nr:FAD-dependent oxidoreductase [Tissierellia bacterium]